MTTTTELRERGRDTISRILANDSFTEDEKLDGIVDALEQAMSAFLDRVVPETILGALDDAQVGVVVGDGLGELLQRGRGLETILAYLIDQRFYGSVSISEDAFERWVESHPGGGHVEDTASDESGMMTLVVHHLGQRES